MWAKSPSVPMVERRWTARLILKFRVLWAQITCAIEDWLYRLDPRKYRFKSKCRLSPFFGSKLVFSWFESCGERYPYCDTGEGNQVDLFVLTHLLNDDSGPDRTRNVSWIKEGIARIDAALNGIADNVTWGGEKWGVDIEADASVIYLFRDGYCTFMMATPALRGVLEAWLVFIQSEPVIGRTVEVEV